jgi:hypothetical protein
MTTRTEIAAEVRARMAGVLPDAADVSGDPEAFASARLPAYALGLSIQDTEPVSMNAPGAFLETANLTVSVWQAGGPGLDDDLRDLADAVNAVMFAEPRDLGGLVEWIRPGDQDPEIVRGERRIGRLDLTFALRFVNRL